MTKSNELKIIAENYNSFVSSISETYVSGKQRVVETVDIKITETYWNIGEQDGNPRAEYGNKLLKRLSKNSTLFHGKESSVNNIQIMKQLHTERTIYAELLHQLS